MNFKMKAVVAAIALTASMSASAAMSNTASGDSSLIMTMLDTTAGVSATFDLGYTKSTFDQTVNNIWNVSTGNYAAAWTSFWAAATTANTQYAVFAGDGYGGVVAGDKSVFTTTNVTGTLPAISNSALGTMEANFDIFIAKNNALSNGAASFADSTMGQAYAGNGVGYGTSGKIAATGGDTNALIGTSMKVINIVRTGVAGNTSQSVLSVNGYNPTFNLSATGDLSYVAVPVPEADTWAMMLAGLGLMGFIARRRTQA